MRCCVSCNRLLSRWAEWKGGDDLFYCSEFCADAAPDALIAPRVRELAAADAQPDGDLSKRKSRRSPDRDEPRELRPGK